MDQNRLTELLAFAREHLGPCEPVADCSWPHRMSAVLRLRDEDGATWFVKQHRDRERLHLGRVHPDQPGSDDPDRHRG